MWAGVGALGHGPELGYWGWKGRGVGALGMGGVLLDWSFP